MTAIVDVIRCKDKVNIDKCKQFLRLFSILTQYFPTKCIILASYSLKMHNSRLCERFAVGFLTFLIR